MPQQVRLIRTLSIRLMAVLGLGLLLAGCGGVLGQDTVKPGDPRATGGPSGAQGAPGAPSGPAQAGDGSSKVDQIQRLRQTYRLGSGDKLRVIVFGEEDLSGEFQVDSEGQVSMPLIGQVPAGGSTLREFESAVTERLMQGYLNDPKVSVEVLNYRPFYIFGEVNEGGEYPYQAGMSVLNAVAVAGGFTYRADTRRAYITREENNVEVEYPLSQDTLVLPGDVIRIGERFF